ncbi:hypothetical protein HRbin06_00091 [archaeon HR06]|nr:hypothetical protein HRbin06_00091 [archaeon HR06]
MTFEEALENLFKCPNCGKVMQLTDNTQIIKAIKWKIEQLEKELKKSF